MLTKNQFDIPTLIHWSERVENIKSYNHTEKRLILYEILDCLGLSIDDLILKGKWFTASEIGNILGVSKQKVGKMANKHKIKGNPEYSLATPVKINDLKYTVSWFYNEKALSIFRNILEEEDINKLMENSAYE